MDEDKKPKTQLAVWWADHMQHNYWDYTPKSWGNEQHDHSEQTMHHEGWRIQCITGGTLQRLLDQKTTPSHYSSDNIANIKCDFDDTYVGYVWDTNDKPTSIGFKVVCSYNGSPRSQSEARTFVAMYQKVEEVCNWLESDPVVDGKRVSEHRAAARNKKEVAKEVRDADKLSRRINDPAHSRKEAAAILDALKKDATDALISDGHRAEAQSHIYVFYRDGLPEEKQGNQGRRKITCEASRYWSSDGSEQLMRAKFYWGHSTSGIPTSRKIILAELQELYSATEQGLYRKARRMGVEPRDYTPRRNK